MRVLGHSKDVLHQGEQGMLAFYCWHFIDVLPDAAAGHLCNEVLDSLKQCCNLEVTSAYIARLPCSGQLVPEDRGRVSGREGAVHVGHPVHSLAWYGTGTSRQGRHSCNLGPGTW